MTAYEAGMKLLRGKYTAYTPDFAAQARKMGAYHSTPVVGAVIEFYSSSKGRVGHTGIVTACEFKNGMWTVETVEGNSSPGMFTTDGGCVAPHKYEFLPSQVGGKNRINGFLYPDFAADTCGAGQFVAMARSQIGYCEKASNDQLDEYKANPGKANYTKYNAWAKGCGWGYQPAEWCATFVSWCAYMACRTAHDYIPGWIQQDDGSWTYRKDGGSICRDEWLHYGGRWYVFDGSGRMVTGWYKAKEGYYYLAGDGALCTSQWVEDDGKNYYMTRSGLMATSCYVRSEMPYKPGKYIYYWVGEDGAWIPKWDTDSPDLRKYYCAT